jgi:putative flippase GtrA
VLQLLVTAGGLPEIVAQAISIIAATPLNFIGNKMWSFGRGVPRR